MSRPVLRWVGGKHRIGAWVLNHFPAHRLYHEPFAGAASVFFRKAPVQLEVLNDLNGDLVNFFKVLRDEGDELIRVIELTPYAREEFMQSYDRPDTLTALERARRFYVCCWQSFGNTLKPTSWRHLSGDTPSLFDRGTGYATEWQTQRSLYAAAARMRGVQIENMDALECIVKYDTDQTLHYVDPPYEMSTRTGADYAHELDDAQHIALAEVLQGCKGHVALSGYRSDLYDELYKGWERSDKSIKTHGQATAIESLWVSPSVSALNSLPLFQWAHTQQGD